MKLLTTTDHRRTITIELTPDDQDVLFTLCGRVSGAMNGPRGVTQKLYDILSNEKARRIAISPNASLRMPDTFTYAGYDE